MGTVLNSFDNIRTSQADNGGHPLWIEDFITVATTNANSTSGYMTGQRFTRTFTQFALGAGLTGAIYHAIQMSNEEDDVNLVCAIEYDLGTLTVSGNSFADGVAMPTKTIRSTSITTASLMPVVVVTVTLTATTPVLTITYTDQDGNTGQTATLTLPTNASANSVFQITPHLAAGDTGIRDITGLSISTGTAGTLKVMGLLPLMIMSNTTSQNANILDVLNIPTEQWLVEANDVIAFYRFGSNSANQLTAVLVGTADN